VALSTLVLLALAGRPARADRVPDRNPDFTAMPPTPEQAQQGMAVWQQMSQPSLYHKRLEYFLGDWTVTTRMSPQGPNAPAQESQGTATYRWLMDGRWLAQDASGPMMEITYRRKP
jgi:hypothetical protein